MKKSIKYSVALLVTSITVQAHAGFFDWLKSKEPKLQTSFCPAFDATGALCSKIDQELAIALERENSGVARDWRDNQNALRVVASKPRKFQNYDCRDFSVTLTNSKVKTASGFLCRNNGVWFQPSANSDTADDATSAR